MPRQSCPRSLQDSDLREERRQLLRSSGRCYIFLKRGHVSRNRHSRARCRLCGDRHHATICTRAAHTSHHLNFVLNPPPLSRVNSGGQRPLNPTATPFNTTDSTTTTAIATTTATSCHAGINQAVFLQTARATVFNPSNTAKQREVTLILDSWNQKSYITDSVKETLDLRGKERKNVSIVTFGSSEGKPHTCDIVELEIRVTGGSRQSLTVLTTPLICEPLMCPTTPTSLADFRRLGNVDLAEFHTDSPLI